MLLEKALGDALVACRFLPDDTAEHYVFGAVHFHKGPKRTELRLRWTAGNQLELPAEAPTSTASPE
jgi:hypothetical protein